MVCEWREAVTSDWHIEGRFMETCNCAFICPCITSNLTAKPTEGDCKAAVAMKIDKGEKDGVSLDGLAFVVLIHSPGPMADGNLPSASLSMKLRTMRKPKQSAQSRLTLRADRWPLWAAVGEMAGIERRPILCSRRKE